MNHCPKCKRSADLCKCHLATVAYNTTQDIPTSYPTTITPALELFVLTENSKARNRGKPEPFLISRRKKMTWIVPPMNECFTREWLDKMDEKIREIRMLECMTAT